MYEFQITYLHKKLYTSFLVASIWGQIRPQTIWLVLKEVGSYFDDK